MKNAPLKKGVKKRGRPENDGERASQQRQESQVLLDRHRERERERRLAAKPEPDRNEVARAERWLEGTGRKQQFSQKALAAVRMNLQAANKARQVQAVLMNAIIEKLEDRAHEKRARKDERVRRRSNPRYMRCCMISSCCCQRGGLR